MSTLCTIKQMSERQPAFTESSLRWIIYNASNPKSGHGKFTKAIHRVGGRVLIDEPNFIAIAKGEV
jgi:hypothetical protein